MNSSKNRLRQFSLVAGVLISLIFPAAALAAPTPSKAGYTTLGGQVQEDVAGMPEATSGAGGGGSGSGGVTGAGQEGTVSSRNSGSSLPFTGTDLALLLAAGGLFLGAGLVMRRLARNPDLA